MIILLSLFFVQFNDIKDSKPSLCRMNEVPYVGVCQDFLKQESVTA